MIYLVRHGETEWSTARRHTGRTDIALTARGREEAAALADVLAAIEPQRVLTSPLARARDTCTLAGFGDQAEVDDRLMEWDYGVAEGRTTKEIQESVPGWSMWTHPVDGAEALDRVGARVDQVLEELRDPNLVSLVFAHAHLLRIMAARWCQQRALGGRNLVLDPASVSVLGYELDTPVIERWNLATF